MRPYACAHTAHATHAYPRLSLTPPASSAYLVPPVGCPWPNCVCLLRGLARMRSRSRLRPPHRASRSRKQRAACACTAFPSPAIANANAIAPRRARGPLLGAFSVPITFYRLPRWERCDIVGKIEDEQDEDVDEGERSRHPKAKANIDRDRLLLFAVRFLWSLESADAGRAGWSMVDGRSLDVTMSPAGGRTTGISPFSRPEKPWKKSGKRMPP